MSYLGKKEIFTIALGSVIGWGAFILPGNVFLPNYGVLNTLVGFSIAILMLSFIENSYAKVMEKVPKSGGEYSFANEILGKKSGFITGWGLLLAYISIIPLNATAVPMVLEAVFPFYSQGALLYSVSDSPVYLNDILISISIVICFTVINILGVKGALNVQNYLVFALLSSILILIFFTLLNIEQTQLANLESHWGQLDVSSVIRIIAFAPWAFIGFDAVAQLAGDHKMSSKSVSRMTMIAIIFGALIYNILNIITALGMDVSGLKISSWATGDSVKALVGEGLFYLIAIAMFGAVVSGLNGFFVSSSRLVKTMADDYNISSSRSGIVSVKTKGVVIPNWVFIAIGVIAIVVPFFGRTALLWFVDLSSVGASIAYFMTCLCAYKISSVFKDKLMSGIGMFVSLAFLIFLLTPVFDSNISLPSYYSLIFWSVLGLVVYLAIKHKRGVVI